MKKNCFKAFGLTEILLVVAIVGILAGTAFSIIASNKNATLEATKLELENKTIAEIYKTNFETISKSEVSAMLSSKENFIESFREYYDDPIVEKSIDISSFANDTAEKVDGITLDNGVSIGFEHVRNDCSNNSGAPCGVIHVIDKDGNELNTSKFFVYEDKLSDKSPYNPQIKTYNSDTNSFDCSSEKVATYLSKKDNTKKLIYDETNVDECTSSCDGIKVASDDKLSCACPNIQPEGFEVPQGGYYDSKADNCFSCLGNRKINNGKCVCEEGLKEACYGIFDDTKCECTSCVNNLVPNEQKTECQCELPGEHWSLDKKFIYTGEKEDKSCNGSQCLQCLKECPSIKVHDEKDITKCICPDVSEDIKFENKHQYYDKNSDTCISECKLEYLVRNEEDVTSCVCPDKKPGCEGNICFDKYFTNDTQYYNKDSENCIAECPQGHGTWVEYGNILTKPTATRESCICDSLEYHYPRRFNTSIPLSELSSKTDDEICGCPSEEVLRKEGYIYDDEEYAPNQKYCKQDKCPVLFVFKGKEVHGIRNANNECECPEKTAFIEGGLYEGYIDFNFEDYDSTNPVCKKTIIQCEDYKKPVEKECVCKTEQEIKEWDPDYISENEEYYAQSPTCKRDKCPVRFEFKGQKIRGIRMADGSCACPEKTAFIEGGLYEGYIDFNFEDYDSTNPVCKKTIIQCEDYKKPVEKECVCKTEQEIKEWDPDYISENEEYYAQSPTCKRDKCPVRFEFKGQKIRGERQADGTCACPDAKEFEEGGKYFGYIDKNTEHYDDTQLNCKKIDTECTKPMEPVNHKCQCMSEEAIKKWNPDYISENEEYYAQSPTCKRDKCPVRFEFNGQKIRGERQADGTCACPEAKEFEEGGKYFGYIDKNTEHYDDTQLNCKKIDTECTKPMEPVNHKCQCMSEEAIKKWNPDYISENEEYYAKSETCKRDKCPVKFEFKGQKIRGIRMADGSCSCPEKTAFIEGGLYEGYIDFNFEDYDSTNPVCKKTIIQCEDYKKPVEKECVCKTEQEIKEWDPNYISENEEYYAQSPTCKRDKCPVRFEFNGQKIRGERQADGTCACPEAKEFEEGGEYFGYIDKDTESYDPYELTCKRNDTVCLEPTFALAHKCVCMSEENIKLWDPDYIGSGEEYDNTNVSNLYTCKQCSVKFNFNGKDVRGVRNAKGECACPDAKEFEEGGKYFGYIDKNTEHYDATQLTCKKTDTECKDPMKAVAHQCVCKTEQEIKEWDPDYISENEEYYAQSPTCKRDKCPVRFEFNGQKIRGERQADGTCACPDAKEFEEGGKYFGYIDKNTEHYDATQLTCKKVDTECDNPMKAVAHKCVCKTEQEIKEWNPDYISEDEEYYAQSPTCKREKCPVRFEFNGQKIRGERQADGTCACPDAKEFEEGGKYFGYIDKNTEHYDATQLTCKKVDTECDNPMKAVAHKCVCKTEQEIKEWNPDYISEDEEYYAQSPTCKREKCPVRFEFNGEKVRGIRMADGSCACPEEIAFLEGGKYFGYIDKNTEHYDATQLTCKKVDTECDNPMKAVAHQCVCKTEQEIKDWNPDYISEDEEYYAQSPTCKRDKCPVRFEFNGQKIRGERQADGTCACPEAKEFEEGGKYFGYIDKNTEHYDATQLTCKKVDTECDNPMKAVAHQCVCKTEQEIKDWNPDYISEDEEYYAQSPTCKRDKCPVRFEFNGQKIRGERQVDGTCACPEAKEFEEGGKYFGYIDKDTEHYDATQLTCKKTDTICLEPTFALAHECVCMSEENIKLWDPDYIGSGEEYDNTNLSNLYTCKQCSVKFKFNGKDVRGVRNAKGECACPEAKEFEEGGKYFGYIDKDTEHYDATQLTCKKVDTECTKPMEPVNHKCVCMSEENIKLWNPDYISEDEEYDATSETCKRDKCPILFYFNNNPVRGVRNANNECVCPDENEFKQGGTYYGYIDENSEHYDATATECKVVDTVCEKPMEAVNHECQCMSENDIKKWNPDYISENEEYDATSETCKREKCPVRFEFNDEKVRGVRTDSGECVCPSEKEFEEGGKYFGYLQRTEVYDANAFNCKVSICKPYNNIYVVQSNNFNYHTSDFTLEYQIKSFSTTNTADLIKGKINGSGFNANHQDDTIWKNLLSKMSAKDKARLFNYFNAYVIADTGEIIGSLTPEMSSIILEGNQNLDTTKCETTYCTISKVGTQQNVEECMNTCSAIESIGSVYANYYPNVPHKTYQYHGEFYGGALSFNGCEYNVQNSIFRHSSPLVLDLKGDGLKFTNVFNGVDFDLNADGNIEKTAWTTNQQEFDNAFLVLDKNNNGIIDNGKELFGDQNGEETGFDELKKYDDNNDGVIDEFDGIFNKLALWVDFNKNGITEANELKTLKEANVTELNVTYNLKKDENGNIATDENDNIIGYVGSFKMIADGIGEVVRTMIDVFFMTMQNFMS